MNPYLLAFNILGWPIIHLAVSKWATSLPIESFEPNSFLYRSRKWEREGNLYQDLFKVKAWKKMLPDGAAWFAGGFSKKRFASKDKDYLIRFALETCRGEWAHWTTIAALPLFLIVNPLWAQIVMAVYAIASNMPCIIVQRYNRNQIQRITQRCHQT